MARSYEKMRKANNAVHRSTYAKRKDEGLCTRCGKRWAEAGQTKCKQCRERDQKWYRDNNMREYLYAYKQKQRNERRENNLCINCGRKLLIEEIGVNSKCKKCRDKDMERITVKRIRMRIHGIKRKY